MHNAKSIKKILIDNRLSVQLLAFSVRRKIYSPVMLNLFQHLLEKKGKRN